MSSAHVDKVAAIFDDWAEAGRAEGMEQGHGPTARPAFDRLQDDRADKPDLDEDTKRRLRDLGYIQ